MSEQPVTEFGARLRRAREAKGISLRHIANVTKISVRALEAVERSDYSRLPGGIFTRSFVRAYAAEVGLDPDSAVQEFLRQAPGSESAQAGLPGTDAADGRESWTERVPVQGVATTLVAILVVGAVGYGVYQWWTTGVRRTHEATAGNTASATETAGTPGTVSPVARTSHDSPGTAAATAAQPQPAVVTVPQGSALAPAAVTAAPTAAALEIAIASNDTCWTLVTADGGTPQERMLRAGDRVTITASREVVLKAGNAGALSLTINGRPARPLGTKGQVVTARIGLDNLADYLLGP